MDYIEHALQLVKENSCAGDYNFFQAVREVLNSIRPLVGQQPRYTENRIIERMVFPNREIHFTIEWLNDRNEIEIHNGYRIQFNNALGPYKGGVRFHPTVNPDILKFLAFEQIFKNAITGLHIGGAKGGADFNPKGRSDREIMKFCQAFMTAFYNAVGADVDILGGDIGVGEREAGYLFGQYKTLTNTYDSIITSKPLSLGGSRGRNSATGFGLIYFTQTILEEMQTSLKGKICTVSGAGNVAICAIEKLYDLGAIPVTCSDSTGAIHDPNGIDLALLKEIKLTKRLSLNAYAEAKQSAHYIPRSEYPEESNYVWQVPCFAAFPCATQNELDLYGAKTLVTNGVHVIAEGANMPTTLEAIDHFKQNGVIFAPAKAANAGGVAVSVLEMSQNRTHNYLSTKEVDLKLRKIMADIYKEIKNTCDTYGLETDLVAGANILGFKRVADAMLAQGV